MAFVSLNSNVLRLSAAQALAGANAAVVYATAAVIGHGLSPDPALSTLPVTIFVLGMALSTIPVGKLVQRVGRRASFLLGNALGIVDGLLAGIAILTKSFPLFCFAMVFGGAYAAIVLTFRFAAAECVGPDERAKALSTVMAGGVFAGVVGPQLVTFSMDLIPGSLFAATYFGSAVAALLSACVLAGIRFDAPPSMVWADGRSTSALMRQPRLITAIVCGAVVYMLMNFLMTSAPLAMEICGIPQSTANLGIQWHIVAMYGPSFVTGSLISRFGANRVVLAGLLLMFASALVGLAGNSSHHFVILLILLGVGWNFGFLGASSLVLECHTPQEKSRVQSLNDFFVFGTMLIGSFLSGGLLSTFGWETVCKFALIPLTIATVCISLISMRRDRGLPAQSAR
ncbi:MFS transporter [Pandoraea aquatica]|uniref:MFS transporter n=1 Tax=Pandoraea aquatica TaxID=2508290 RepID=A0A5E4VSG0_9BURK|nr:MFS transporter [Pandoraea aquatica]VVE14204.1 MFS transporter [Pandoraea aquatica]